MANRCVLLVEPEPGIARLIHLVLLHTEVDIHRVPDAAEGLECLEHEGASLVILDVPEPCHCSGEVAEFRKATSAPLLLLTTSDDPSATAEALGVQEVVREPFEPDELCTRVKSLLHHDAHAGLVEQIAGGAGDPGGKPI